MKVKLAENGKQGRDQITGRFRPGTEGANPDYFFG
jgi:hypothetical protein